MSTHLLNPLDLKVPAHWRDPGFCHKPQEPVFLLKGGTRSYGVCADRFDLVTGLTYTPGWLSPDGPKITLSSLGCEFFEKKACAVLKSKIGRAVAAYRAIVQVLDSYVPEIRKKHYIRLEKSRAELWFTILKLSLDNLMEKSLKKDLQQLLAYGTGKSNERSIIVFSGFIRKLLLTRAIRMMNPNKSGRVAAGFIRSLYETKRCWEVMPDELRDESIEKHKKLMKQYKSCASAASFWIKEAVDLVIPPGTSYRPESNCNPTYSACFENSREKGGNHSYVLGGGATFEIGDRAGQKKFSDDLEYRLFNESVEQSVDVKLQMVLDPGKFRAITVGRGALYSSLRVFQAFLLSQWKKQRFSTMNDNVLSRILRLRRANGSLYYSGDYVDSTDNLSMEATLVALKRVCENLGIRRTYLYSVAKRSFDETNIHYPDGEVIRQVGGQLMGHPLSFFFLCVINLSVFLRTYGVLSYNRYLLRRVLINGDDILFKGEPEHGDMWRRYSSEVGFVVNEVKSYESSRWALINSIFVDMDHGIEVRYIPLAVSTGHNVKVGEVSRTLSQGPQIWSLIRDQPCERAREMCTRVLFRTLTRLSPKIGEFSPNFFVHKRLGGLGLSAPEGWNYGVSDSQRRVATYFMREKPKFIWSEKISELPKSAQVALKKVGKMLPVYDEWRIGRCPVQGPVFEFEDMESYFSYLLPFAIKSTGWEVGCGYGVDYVLQHNYQRALRHREVSCSGKKIKNYLPARSVCWLPHSDSWGGPTSVDLSED